MVMKSCKWRGEAAAAEAEGGPRAEAVPFAIDGDDDDSGRAERLIIPASRALVAMGLVTSYACSALRLVSAAATGLGLPVPLTVADEPSGAAEGGGRCGARTSTASSPAWARYGCSSTERAESRRSGSR